ncbi:MAG: DUF2059 domain-containing protein [Marinibacterium sp.]
MTYLCAMMYAPLRPAARLALFVALLLSLVMPVSAARAADRARIEAFLQVTGFDVALESLKYSASAAPDMLGFDAGEFGLSWTALTKDVFDVDTMHDLAVDILEQTLSDDLLAHAAGFYASDLGSRLVATENASHLDPDDDAKQARGTALVAEMVETGAPRLELLKRMNRAVDASGMSVRAVQEVQMRFLLAASAAGVIELRLDADELAAMMKAQEGEMQLAMAQSALAGSAEVYREYTDAEIKAYTEALEDPDMQSVYQLMNAIQYEIMADRFEVLASRMADLHPAEDI